MPRSLLVLALLFGRTFLLTNAVSAQRQDVSSSVTAKNIVYGEVAFFVVNAAASINYERILHQHFSGRVGYGVGGVILGFAGEAGTGPLAMVNFFTRGRHKLEIGAGVTVIYRFGQDWITNPAFALGYRLQQPDTNFFLRVGLTWTYRYAAPAQVSAGLTF